MLEKDEIFTKERRLKVKLKNTITGNTFFISLKEGKKLLERYDCFDVIDAKTSEENMIKEIKKSHLSIQQKVFGDKKH